MGSFRWDEAALAAFKKRAAQWRAEGAVRTHVTTPKPYAKLPKVKGPSELEVMLELQILGSALPAPLREFEAFDDRKFRLDFAWPERRIGVEVQGMVHRIKGRFGADIEKRALHMLAGWRVLEVSRKEIKSGAAIEWLLRLWEGKR